MNSSQPSESHILPPLPSDVSVPSDMEVGPIAIPSVTAAEFLIRQSLQVTPEMRQKNGCRKCDYSGCTSPQVTKKYGAGDHIKKCTRSRVFDNTYPA